VADIEALGEHDGWTCWLCGREVPRRAKPNDPNQPVADQIAPAAKGAKGRGEVRLAHKRCNDARKGRPPSIPWPERFAVVDAPELLSSLARIEKRGGRGEVVAMCVDAESAAAGAVWVVPVARTLYPGEWTTSLEPVSQMTAIRLVKEP
jgi:hypothetical protein